MGDGKYNLKLALIKRFLRTYIPQLIVYLPVMMTHAEQIKEFLPLWGIPVLGFIASVVTAGDKLYRELKKLK
ncbi:MAG TPA: hypothetical protein ENI23_14490 [bacterium]|nr:hypothetical protein [bacterium]